jgi:hypothetical protein
VTIPASVVSLGNQLFFACYLLQEVRFEGHAPNVANSNNLYLWTFSDLTTYVYHGTKGWDDGDPNSSELPETWCERPIAYIKGFTFNEVPVPHWWLKMKYPEDEVDYYETRLGLNGDNKIPVWQSWVALLDPNDPKSQFTAFIEMDGDKPVITCAPFFPKYRNYTTLGKASLSDLGPWKKADENSRFFKVKVELK